MPCRRNPFTPEFEARSVNPGERGAAEGHATPPPHARSAIRFSHISVSWNAQRTCEGLTLLWNHGLAYLDGGNTDIDESYVVETYYRATLSEHLALTGDVQWIKDENAQSGDDDAEGWIVGLRLVAGF